MSMTNQEEFAARLARVRNGGAHTKATIFVGQDEQHLIRREAPQQQSKSREVASNALYPLSLAGAFVLGLFAVALGYYARFQFMAGQATLSDDADLEMAISGVIGMMLSFVLAQIFRLTSKEHKGLQGAGVFVMICAFHNFAHWAPGPMSVLFSPEWVANIQTEAPPNSAKFRGVYFPLFDKGSAAVNMTTAPTDAAAAPAVDCAAAEIAEAPAAPSILQTDNAKKAPKTRHKVVTVAEAKPAGCAEP